MLYRLRTKAKRWIFDWRIRGILKTKPISFVPAPWTILSMISHADVLMYLLAIKSFYSRLGRGKILIIDDGSLTAEDMRQLSIHLASPEIISRDTITIGRFPRHLMWERLACALDLSEKEYVIQLDADTVTIGPVDQVRGCVLENRAFTLGTWWHGQEHLSARQAADYARSSPAQDHIQIRAEMALAELPGADALKYIRGSAGLAGLAKGGFSRSAAEDFWTQMLAKFGPRFLEWGTDQIAFNFIVANSPNSYILPYPAYACFGPETEVNEGTAFLHFIGTYRFMRGEFARHGRKFIGTASSIRHA
jgi:hypothetical protein